MAFKANYSAISSGNFETLCSKGTDNGQLNGPIGISADAEGNLLIADTKNNRVQVISSTGSWIKNLGKGRGDQPGHLNDPTDVAVNSEGDIFVVERGNHRISVFSSEGKFKRTFGSEGTGAGHLFRPWGITIDSQDRIIVAEYGNERVQVFNKEGEHVLFFGHEGICDGEFHRPKGVAVNSEDNILVTDGNCYIQVFDKNGTFMFKIGSEGKLPGQFGTQFKGSVMHVTVDSFDRIVVTDHFNHRLQFFEKDGTFLAQYGEQGSGADQFDGPDGVVVFQSKIAVVDCWNGRIQLISPPFSQ